MNSASVHIQSAALYASGTYLQVSGLITGTATSGNGDIGRITNPVGNVHIGAANTYSWADTTSAYEIKIAPLNPPSSTNAGTVYINCPTGGCILGTAALYGTTGSIGGSALAAGAAAQGSVAITSATGAMVCTASPAAYCTPDNGGVYFDVKCEMSSSALATVKVIAPVAGTPTACTYNVHVNWNN